MTTPRQERKTIETPFGEAVVNDWRGSNNGDKTKASIMFDHFVANRKEYGSITLYLERWAGSRNHTVSTASYNTLTPAARLAVSEYFAPIDGVHADLAPYAEDLDAEDVRASLKSSVAHKALSALHDVVTRHVAVESRELAPEVLDEVLREALAKRAEGLSYTKIYLSL